jgi:hypothetical protein
MAKKLFNNIKWSAIGLSSVLISQFDKKKGQKFLLDSFRNMPGVPAKFSQLLELKLANSDLLKDQLKDKLRDQLKIETNDRAVDSTTPNVDNITEAILDIEEVKILIRQENEKLYNEIEEIADQGFSASLGQVHWAKLRDQADLELAIKIQYPGLDSDLPDQLGALLFLMRNSPAKSYGLNIAEYERAFQEYIGREINYKLEAKIQTQFYENFKEDKRLCIPKVFESWSSEKILVQEFVEAVPFFKCGDLCTDEREHIAKVLVEFWLSCVFEKRLIHTDLQPKNWGYNASLKKLVIYDFGSWLELTSEQCLLLESLIEGLLDRNQSSPLDLLVALGFDGEKLLPLLNRLPILLETLLDPFLTSGWWQIEKWNLASKLDNILGTEAWWFRAAGPPWFLWLIRSAQGLFAALEALKVGVPFQSIFFDVIIRLSRERFANFKVEPQAKLLERFQRNPIYFKHEARQFCVKVTEEARDIVSLEFPIHVVDDLEQLMSEDVRTKIESLGYSLTEIKKRMIKEGLLIGPVLDFYHGKRHYQLWTK